MLTSLVLSEQCSYQPVWKRAIFKINFVDNLRFSSDCFMNKMDRDVAISLKSKFYERFVDHTYRRRKKLEPFDLFDKIIYYHPNIKSCLFSSKFVF